MLTLKFFTTNSSLVFLKLLFFNSLDIVKLNQTSVNQIQQNLTSKTGVY